VGIGKLLINWSPVGLLYKAFAAALKYLGVDLPAKFTDFGGHLIDGLINGIKNKWESLKTTVTDMGDSVGGWFKEKLGIIRRAVCLWALVTTSRRVPLSACSAPHHLLHWPGSVWH
jgi:hypothetical protein